MKIGIDARLYQETGVGRYIRNLIKWLALIDTVNKYTVIVLKKDSEAFKIPANWDIFATDVKWHTLQEQLKLGNQLNKLNLDLIHFPYFSVPLTYRGKFVVTIHDLTNLRLATGRASTLPYPVYLLKHIAFKFILSQAITRSAAVIVPSNTIKDDLLSYNAMVSDKVFVTYEGGMEQTSNKLRPTNTSLANRLPRNFMLYVGNVYPHKNPESILSILSLLKNHKDQPLKQLKSIVVCKNDYFLKRFKENARVLELEDQLIYFENVSDSELNLLYQKALFLIYPSFSEGFGLPLVEAMQNNCLVLCSNIAIFHEIGTEKMYFFDPFKPETAIAKIESIFNLNDSGKQELIKSYQTKLKNYSWQDLATKTLAVYQRN